MVNGTLLTYTNQTQMSYPVLFRSERPVINSCSDQNVLPQAFLQNRRPWYKHLFRDVLPQPLFMTELHDVITTCSRRNGRISYAATCSRQNLMSHPVAILRQVQTTCRSNNVCATPMSLPTAQQQSIYSASAPLSQCVSVYFVLLHIAVIHRPVARGRQGGLGPPSSAKFQTFSKNDLFQKICLREYIFSPLFPSLHPPSSRQRKKFIL